MKHESGKSELIDIIAEGISDGFWRIARLIAIGVFALFVIQGIFDLLGVGKDSTDPANGRSGLELRTDAMTGCQYLESSDGALTPRLGRNGKQVCR